MTKDFEQLVAQRRSIYSLGRNLELTESEIASLVETAILHCPTPFNSQSGRVAILFNKYNQWLWKTVSETLEPHVAPEQFAKTRAKVDTFAAGVGTVLYFIDDDVTQALQQKFALYADKFPVWAEQSIGILQYIVWDIFAEHQIGASLQHYNPLIDDAVTKHLELPLSWRLTAQMPFGSIEAPAASKTFEPIESRLKIFA